MLTLYIEKNIKDHPKTQEICGKFKNKRIIEIERYTEIFNRKNQDFRLQKEKGNAFILAKKQGEFVLPSPSYCPAKTEHKYYFSQMYNCPYDCEYCFLQGMYQCAYPVFFVNTQDFQSALQHVMIQHKDKPMTFFAGYDNDSLAFESLTGFSQEMIQWFSSYPNSILELRTKSQYTALFDIMPPTKNTVIAFTVSPKEVQQQWEHTTPSLSARVHALKKIQKSGWKVAIRLEPLIIFPDWEKSYEQFFNYLQQEIDFEKIEDIMLGVFRLPKETYKIMRKRLPHSKLLAQYYEEKKNREMSYEKEKEEKIFRFVYKRCCALLPKEKIYYYRG